MPPFPSYTHTWHTSSYPSISPARLELSLAGKTAVITGGGSGIGLAISKSLALAGVSKLAIIGRRPSVLSAAASNIISLPRNKTQVFTASADISSKAEIEKAFSRIAEQFGGEEIDLLITNAGYFNGPRPLGTETDEEFQKMLDINIKGVYLTTAAFVAKAAPDATIINVSSAIAHLNPFPGFPSYAATKLAGSMLMRYVADENPEMHIVDLHPGQVRETEMAQKVLAHNPGNDHIDDGTLLPPFSLFPFPVERN
jgi:NAD(P)-dependent dehydrogenase (short-subunit alcohol dehydrogenase family)